MKLPKITQSLQYSRQRLLAMLGLCFVLVMVALDQTVIGTALPTIVSELNGFNLYAWVGTSYLLTSVITVPIFGKLGDEHGRKPFVIAAILLFTLASMLCGMAGSMLQLVLARAFQGIGGGMLMATAFACIADLFPDALERLRWMAMFSTAYGLANAVGPTLGGYLAEYWGWRWVFFVNLPVGIVSLGFVWRYLPKIRYSEHPPTSMDWLGALLVAVVLGCLQLLIEWLPLHKPVYVQVALGIIASVSGLALVWWESRCKNPILPMEMFRHGTIARLFALSLMMGFCMFAVMYYAPLMFQGGFGLSPNRAGLLVTPLAVFITVGSILNGRIVTRLRSPKSILYTGLACFTVSAVAMTQTSSETSQILVAFEMMLAGLGLGFILPNLTLIAQVSVPRTQLGVVTAMLQSTRIVGSMMGTAVIGSIISSLYTSKVSTNLVMSHATQWSSWLNDPQILFNHEREAQFITMATIAGNDAIALISEVRNAMIYAIHYSQWFVTIFTLFAFWLVYLMPTMNIRSEKAKINT